jgi:predicted acyl esterase
VTVAGPILLNLFAKSTNTDTDFIVKLSEQMAQPDRAGGKESAKAPQPRSRVVTKGWLRASHRAIDAARSLENAPWYDNTTPEPIEQGQVYKFEIAVMPTAYRFKKGSRIRLEIANGDSQLTEFVFQHDYAPGKVGTDTIYFSREYPSHIVLPVMPE